MIDVVLPCLDEAESLPWVLGRMPAGYRAIVADNGSSDNSVQIAQDLGALVAHAPQRGFGAAAHAGLMAATSDIVCFMDADGSIDPVHLPKVSDPVAHRQADMVLGRRRPTRGAWPVHARLGNEVLAWRLRRRGIDVHDLGPLRALRRTQLIELDLSDRRFGYPLEMLVKAGLAGWNIQETDVTYAPRTGGKSKVSGSVRGTLRAVKDMSGVLK